jgi:GH15 family glucan-1,4-alpha-glucosidase
MLEVVDKSFLLKKSTGEWNSIIIKFLRMSKREVRRAEKLYRESVGVLKRLQLGNGAIYASPPSSRYPYVYPRDHSICILGLISAGLLKRAKRALDFILKSQNPDGSFPQRLSVEGRDMSYKPIQLDNTALVLYAFAKYIKASNDKDYLKSKKKKIRRSVRYIESQLHKKNLFFTPNSIHELPPYERGLEVWVNAACHGALKELEELNIRSKVNLGKVKKAIGRYLWNGTYFIKNIRLKESSSVVNNIDPSSYGLAYFGVFEEDNERVIKTVHEIEEKLTHPKLGGICRYQKLIGRNNGGWGPWPHFTLMICRHYINIGNKRKADKYLKWILDVAYRNLLPEHIALKKDFEEWVSSYTRAGLLRRDRKTMIENIRKNRMYKRRGIAYSVLPLAWPHAEFILAWNLYVERFF